MIKLFFKKGVMTREVHVNNNTFMTVIKGTPHVVDVKKLHEKCEIIETKIKAGQPMGISDLEFEELLKIKGISGEDAIAEDMVTDYESMGWVLLERKVDK